MTTATVTTNGRVTIPKDVRDALELNPGDRIEFVRLGRFEYELRIEGQTARDQAVDIDA